MNVTLEKTSDVVGKIIVNVTESDYASKVSAELKNIAKTHTIPGFRKGHVPAAQLERRFGKQVKSDVLNHEVFNEVIKYIQENKLNVLGEPLPAEVKEVNLDDKDYTFEYEIGFAPEIDVTLDKNITLPYYEIAVSKEMLDEQDKSLCERFGAQVAGEEVDDRAVIKGTFMQLNEDGSINENEGAIQVTDGMVGPFVFKSKEEADKFIGKKVDDKVVFNPYNAVEGNEGQLAAMLHVDKKIAADVKSDFQFTISEILVVKPAEHDQEFFDNVFGKDKVHNEEEYEKALTEMISGSLKGNSEGYFDYTTQKAFLEKYGEMALPTEFLKKWLVARNEELNADNIDAEYEKMLPSLKWQLLRDRIATKLEVKLEEDDILNHAKGIAARHFAQYGMTSIDDETITATAKRILEDKNYRTQIVEEVSDLKLFHAIKEAVNVDTKTVSLDEFKEMVKPAQD